MLKNQQLTRGHNGSDYPRTREKVKEKFITVITLTKDTQQPIVYKCQHSKYIFTDLTSSFISVFSLPYLVISLSHNIFTPHIHAKLTRIQITNNSWLDIFPNYPKQRWDQFDKQAT